MYSGSVRGGDRTGVLYDSTLERGMDVPLPDFHYGPHRHRTRYRHDQVIHGNIISNCEWNVQQQVDEVTRERVKWERPFDERRLRSRRANTELVTACANGDLAAVRLLVPDSSAAMRGAPHRLSRERIVQTSVPLSDGIDLVYDFQAFWYDLDCRLYGRNRQYGVGSMRWDYCEENAEHPELVGHTALTAASKNGHVHIIKHLRSVTPFLPYVNPTGKRQYQATLVSTRDTPCHLAAGHGHWKSLRQLIRHAQPSTRDDLNPLFWPNTIKLTPCGVAVKESATNPSLSVSDGHNIHMCILLLVCYGDSINFENYMLGHAGDPAVRGVIDMAVKKRMTPSFFSYWNIAQLENRTAQIASVISHSVTGTVCKIIAEYDTDIANYALDQPVPHDIVDAFFYAMAEILKARTDAGISSRP